MGSTGPLAAFLVVSTAVLGGATVAYYEESLPTTMNPLFARSMVDFRSHELVFDRLFYRSAITNELRSRVVLKYEKLDGGQNIKVYLKPGIKWHDGEPLKGSDVCFTINAMLNEKTASPIAKPYREAIASCVADDKEASALITFKRLFYEPRERLGFSILPAHMFSGTLVTPDSEFSQRPVGTGAMKGSAGKREVRFEAYANAHHSARVEVLSLAESVDPFVQVRTLINAGVHGLVAVSPGLRSDVSASDDVALKSYDLRSWWFVALNTKKAPLTDVKVRQALNNSIDRSALRELTIGVDPEDTNPPCEFVSGPFVQSSPYYNRSVLVTERSNLSKATDLMKQAGATQQNGKWLYKGAIINLKIGIAGPLELEAKDLLNQLGNQLQQAGFDREVYKISADDWSLKAVSGQLSDYDLLIGKWSFGLVEDVNPLFQTRSGTKGALNIFNYSDKATDDLLARYEAARTDTEARDAYHELHALLAENLPYLFLWKLDTKSAWRNEVRNNTIAPYYYFTEFDGWKLEEG
jgi:peptide/nickel transport system substrate-binding protein